MQPSGGSSFLCSIWKTMRFLGIGTEGKLKASLQTIEEFAAM